MKTFCPNNHRLTGKRQTAVSVARNKRAGETTENEVPGLDRVDGLCRRSTRFTPSESGTFFVRVSGLKVVLAGSNKSGDRNLKIEDMGDAFLKHTIPAIRLKGKWLAAAGFPPGSRVEVKVLANGLIQLRKTTP